MTLSEKRSRLALVKASVAFLQQWERDGGIGVRQGREALLRVFQYDPPEMLDWAIRLWLTPRHMGRHAA